MIRADRLAASFVVVIVLASSCAPSAAPQPASERKPSSLHADGADRGTYLPKRLRERPVRSRTWAKIVSVGWTENPETQERAIRVVGVAVDHSKATRIDGVVYTSDGACGPVTETTLSTDGSFQFVFDLPERYTNQKTSRFETIRLDGMQWLFVDVRADVWASEDGGQLKPISAE